MRKGNSDKVNIESKYHDRCTALIAQMRDGPPERVDDAWDLLMWVLYGPDVLSQSGMGLTGWSLRQRPGSWIMTIKVIDSGTPLVGFVTTGSPMGCIVRLLDLLENDGIRWQKDKYP